MNDEEEGKGSKEEDDTHNNLESNSESKQGEKEDGLDAADSKRPTCSFPFQTGSIIFHNFR